MTDQEFAILEELLNKHQAELREVPSKPKQKAEEKPKKLKLSPLSYARVSRFFHKMYVRHLTRKIDAAANTMVDYEKSIVEEPHTAKEVSNIAIKLERLQRKVTVLEAARKMALKAPSRALRLKKSMLESMEKTADGLYKFDINPFAPTVAQPSDSTTAPEPLKESEPEPESLSFEDQLTQALGSPTPEPEEPLSLGDQLDQTLGSSAPESAPTEPLSLGSQLDQALETPKEEPPIAPDPYQAAYDARMQHQQHQNGFYNYKHDEIIQDPILTAPPALEPVAPAPALLPPNEPVFTPPSNPLDEAKKREYEAKLDQASELVRSSSGMAELGSSEELTALLRQAEEEERKAAAIEDEARLAKEAALIASREKAEKEKQSAEADARYRQLLVQFKANAEERIRNARLRIDQASEDLAENRNLASGIQAETSVIAEEVAKRQKEISDLTAVLGERQSQAAPSNDYSAPQGPRR